MAKYFATCARTMTRSPMVIGTLPGVRWPSLSDNASMGN